MKRWLKCLPVIFLVGIGLFAYRDFILKPAYFWPPGDWLQYSFIEEFIRQSILKAKDLPLWDPNQFSGMVFLAQPITKVFSVTLPLILIAGETSFAIRLDWLFHFLVAGAGFYWLLRSFRVRLLVALAAGIAYMLGGIFNNFPYNTSTFFLGFAWLPLVFGCFWHSLFQKKAKLAVIAGILIAIQILAGQGPIVVYESLILALVSVYYFLTNLGKPQKILSNFWLVVRNYFLSFGVGGVLSAVKLLPVLEFSQYTDRQVLNLHFAELIKTPFLGHLFDFSPSTSNSFRLFVGFLWPALSLLGILGLFHKKTWRISLFLLILLVFFYFASMGANLNKALPDLPNLYEILWRLWPGFDALFFPARLLALVIFLGLILAGLGFNLILDLVEKLSHQKWIAILLALILLGATLFEFLNFTQKFTKLYQRDTTRPENLKETLPWAKEFQNSPHSFRALNLDDDDPTSQYFVLKEGYQNAGGASSAYFDFYLPYLAAGSRHGKFYTGGVEVWKEKSLKRLGEFNVKYIINKTYEDARFGLKEAYHWEKGGRELFAWENPFFRERLWTPAEIFYLVGKERGELAAKKSLALLNFIEEKGSSPAIFYQTTSRLKGMPAGETVFVADDSSEKLLRAKDIKFQRLNFEPIKIPIELDNADHNMEKDRPGFILSSESQNILEKFINPFSTPPSLDFQILDFGVNKVKIQVQTSQSNQPIVYAENNYPGWRAELNKKEVPIFTAQGSMKGVVIENPGSHTLEFKFISQSFKIGLLVSVISLIGLIFFWLKFLRKYQ